MDTNSIYLNLSVGLKNCWDTVSFIFYIVKVYSETVVGFFIPRQMKSLQGETILITGSGNGIGREICLQLAQQGATLVCWDFDKQKNEEVVKKLRALGAKAFGYHVDVSNREKVEATAVMVRLDVGSVSIVINNAGIQKYETFLQMTPEDLEQIFQVNCFSHFWILREFLPEMIKQERGHIITTCSVAGRLGLRYHVPYSGSKFAVNGYLEALKDEMTDHPNIKFTTVYPFVVNTTLVTKTAAYIPTFKLVPILDAKIVATKIIEGMRREAEFVYCPEYFRVFAAFREFLPLKLEQAGSRFFQASIERNRRLEKL